MLRPVPGVPSGREAARMPGTWTWEAGQDPGMRDGVILRVP